LSAGFTLHKKRKAKDGYCAGYRRSEPGDAQFPSMRGNKTHELSKKPYYKHLAAVRISGPDSRGGPDTISFTPATPALFNVTHYPPPMCGGAWHARRSVARSAACANAPRPLCLELNGRLGEGEDFRPCPPPISRRARASYRCATFAERGFDEEVEACLALLAGMGGQRGLPETGSATPVPSTDARAPT
jgi:hypothetical protein